MSGEISIVALAKVALFHDICVELHENFENGSSVSNDVVVVVVEHLGFAAC